MDASNELYYQVQPHEYFVKDFFLAKSLLYVLHYVDDGILFDIALDEAASKYKIARDDIIKHVNNIKQCNTST